MILLNVDTWKFSENLNHKLLRVVSTRRVSLSHVHILYSLGFKDKN